ncbi:MAG: hypothetical protein U5J95_01210 [Balneolaceae bacterium]|nr:hypothetical protein [Balneolaceae bacterium]
MDFLQSASYNFNRNIKSVRLFEMGNVFTKSDKGTYYDNIKEETNLLMGISVLKTIEHWKTDPEVYDIFDVKASLQNFLTQFVSDTDIKTSVNDKEQLEYTIGGLNIGVLYSVDKNLLGNYDIDYPAFAAEISLSKLAEAVSDISTVYNPVSKFPSFEFDFAVVVDSYNPCR